MSAWPATGETMPLVLAASSETALSKASGPSSIAAGDLPAIGHLAERGGIKRGLDFLGDRLDRREDGHSRLVRAQRVGQVDGVLDDVALVLQRRVDVDRRVGDEKRPGISGASMAKTWLMRRAVRRPRSSHRRPRASARPYAARPSSGPRPCRRAPWRPLSPLRRALCSVATISKGARSSSAWAAAARILCSGPTSTGTIKFGARRFDRRRAATACRPDGRRRCGSDRVRESSRPAARIAVPCAAVPHREASCAPAKSSRWAR